MPLSLHPTPPHPILAVGATLLKLSLMHAEQQRAPALTLDGRPDPAESANPAYLSGEAGKESSCCGVGQTHGPNRWAPTMIECQPPTS